MQGMRILRHRMGKPGNRRRRNLKTELLSLLLDRYIADHQSVVELFKRKRATEAMEKLKEAEKEKGLKG